MIKVTKISEAGMPDFKSADWRNFIPGASNPGVSLPLDYTVKGEFILPLEVGSTIFLRRTERNGVKSEGVFISSVITSIKRHGNIKVVETRNSIYILEEED